MTTGSTWKFSAEDETHCLNAVADVLADSIHPVIRRACVDADGGDPAQCVSDALYHLKGSEDAETMEVADAIALLREHEFLQCFCVEEAWEDWLAAYQPADAGSWSSLNFVKDPLPDGFELGDLLSKYEIAGLGQVASFTAWVGVDPRALYVDIAAGRVNVQDFLYALPRAVEDLSAQ